MLRISGRATAFVVVLAPVIALAACTEAQGCARKAQNVDPESIVAMSFHARVETAIAMNDIDVRARRPRTGRR